MAYEYKGQHDEATTEFTRGVELSHGDPVAKAFLARSYAAAGQKDQATQILNELLQLATRQYMPPAEISATFTALGRNDEAFTWLNKAYDERAAALVYLRINRDYDSIRGDPRFQDLLGRMHLQ